MNNLEKKGKSTSFPILLILISLFIIVWSFGVFGIQPECNATIYEFNSIRGDD